MTKQREDLKYLDLNYWIGRWEQKDAMWHSDNVNPNLEKYISLLDGGKENLKFFVPLCGKTLDMKWLFDRGHRVVGMDCCQLVLEDFFKEHSMEYTAETQNGIPVFSEKSGRIVLYCCNIFDFLKTGEGSFDAVWDRGSFVAINPGERTSYVDLLTTLKTRNTAHLIEINEYDDSLYKECPFSIPMSEVMENWGERYHVTLIESQEASWLAQSLNLDPESTKRNIFLLTQK